MTCVICYDNCENKYSCETCNETSCEKCWKLNTDKCCFCGDEKDDLTILKTQYNLLDSTKLTIIDSTLRIPKTNVHHSDPSMDCILKTTKPCPNCQTRIEKYEADCSQMFCTICATVFSWQSGKIVTHSANYHNSLYFERPYTIVKKLYQDKLLHTISSKMYKCIRYLHDEKYILTKDLFSIRVNYINGQLSDLLFCEKILSRYKVHRRDVKLYKCLLFYVDKLSFDNLRIVHDSLQEIDKTFAAIPIVQLPYC